MADISNQYRTISAGAGWADRSGRGRLRLAGADAPVFLQALVSNDLSALERGAGAYATYLTPQGRMIADLRIYHRGSHLIVDVPPGLGQVLADRFDQLVFSEDVQVADATAALAQWLVVGPAASTALATVAGGSAGALDALPLWSQVDAVDGFVARTDDAASPSFDLFVPVASAARIRADLLAAGAVEMSEPFVEALRIDAGRPAFGVDMDTETIPLEAGLLERGISTEKGCYVGQEVIIRILHRGGGRVARRLVRLRGAGADAPPPGTTLLDAGRDVGRLTSVAASLDGAGWIALGYVQRDSAEAGRTLALSGQPAVQVSIAGLAG